MPNEPLNVLLVEDNPADAELMTRELRRAGFNLRPQRIETEAEYLEKLSDGIDIILSDYCLPNFSGARALKLLKERGLDIPFIIVSGTIGEETAVAAMRDGADDYLLKDRIARLGEAAKHALAQKQLRDERKAAEENLRKLMRRHELILNSTAEGIHGIDLEGDVTFENPKAIELLGWTGSDLIGRPAHAAIHHSHADGTPYPIESCPIYASMRDGEIRRVTNDVFWRKNGSSFRVDYVSAPIRDEKGKILGCIVTFRDNTEQFMAEQRLKLQEQQYRLLFQTNPNPMYVFDLTTLQILAANAAACARYGYGKDEFLTLTLKELRPSEDVPALMQALATQSPTHFNGEFQHKRKDGSTIRVEIYSGGVIWDGVPARIVTAIDVTERKRAKEQLIASQKLTEDIIDAIPVRVFWKDSSLVYLGCNAAFARDTGLTDPKEIIGKNDYELAWRDQAERYRDDDREVIETGRPKLLIEEPQTTPEGKPITLLTTKIPLRNSSGEISGVIGAYMDITDRKKAEERLRAQAEIIDRAHDAIIICNHEDLRIVFWNKGAERLYGWTAAELDGRAPVDLALNALDKSGEFRGELKQITKEGKELIADVRATLVRDANGVAHSILIICADITEQKSLQIQLLRAQRLESIGTLASGVAHDLNNILTPIMVCAEALEDITDPKHRKRALDLIMASARRGAAVIKQVLTFARGIEGGRVAINPNHLIDEMADIARNTFPKSIEIMTETPKDLWSIEGDPTQLHQVLLNLSVNARDAMPKGGLLTLAVENVDIDETFAATMPEAKVGRHVLLRVSDNGIGMSRATVEKIFDPFFTTKQIGKGTGLGLSTTLGIVKSHGGFVSVQSEGGRGTTFQVFLPAAGVEAAIFEATSEQIMRGSNELILVVDDEKPVRQVMRLALERNGYRVLEAVDGPEALALIAQHLDSIALVVSDMILPYMDGVTFIRALRKMNPEVPIIASTGQGEPPLLSELESLAVKHFLPKPYGTEGLLSKVHEALTG
jgi:PAS domain S-box-containing protein